MKPDWQFLIAGIMVLGVLSQDALAQDTQSVLSLVNREREIAGCKPLALEQRLTAAARRQAEAMSRQNFFAHTGPDGATIGQRVSQEGYEWVRVAENIAAGYSRPETVVGGWMRSSGHRANIVNCNFSETGIFVVFDPDDAVFPQTPYAYRYYWVQVFARPLR